MTNQVDWRKLPVRRDNQFADLESKLCSTKSIDSRDNDSVVFGTIKELMVFAALVGFELDEFFPLNSRVDTTPILLETYASTKHDQYIFLIALAKSRSIDLLKDDGLKEAIVIFESYCNGGLKKINEWLVDGTHYGVKNQPEVLFKKAIEHLTRDE